MFIFEGIRARTQAVFGALLLAWVFAVPPALAQMRGLPDFTELVSAAGALPAQAARTSRCSSSSAALAFPCRPMRLAVSGQIAMRRRPRAAWARASSSLPMDSS